MKLNQYPYDRHQWAITTEFWNGLKSRLAGQINEELDAVTDLAMNNPVRKKVRERCEIYARVLIWMSEAEGVTGL